MTTSLAPRAIHGRLPQARLRWLALAALMLPVLLVGMDNTALAFALPELARHFAPTASQQLWIVDAYQLVLTGLLVPFGALGDRIGRRRILVVGSSGFVLVSVATAFAPDAGWIIAGRAAMAIFGAAIMPATLSLIRNLFPDAAARRFAVAVWSACFAAGAALGPIVGGALLEHFYWGSVFLMAAPVLVPFLLVAPALIPESRDPQPAPVDLLSIALAFAAMTPLAFGVKALASGEFPMATATAAILVAVAAGVAFVTRQRGSAQPMLDVGLFRNPALSGGAFVNLISTFALVGFLFFVTQHLQLVRGHSPLAAAELLVPGMVMTIIAGLGAARLSRFMTPATLIAGALALNAAAYLLTAYAATSRSDTLLLLAFVLLGAGTGVAETLASDSALTAAPADKAGAAAAISETAYEGGGVFGTAVLGSILAAVYSTRLELPSLAPELAAEARATLGGATNVAAGLDGPTAQALLDSARSAFDAGVVATSSIGAALMLVGAAVGYRLLSAPVSRPK